MRRAGAETAGGEGRVSAHRHDPAEATRHDLPLEPADVSGELRSAHVFALVAVRRFQESTGSDRDRLTPCGMCDAVFVGSAAGPKV
jgi:hypothetical protein